MRFVRSIALPAALSAATIIMSIVAFTSGPAVANETITYNYDVNGRLVLVTHSGDVNNGLVANYSFDDADNRKTLNVTGSPN